MRLALGTVQFGLNYGISNTKGQVSLNEVKKIITQAQRAEIDTLDTAYLYGKSELILGEVLKDFSSNAFKIITKLPPIKQKSITQEALIEVQKNFDDSCKRLKKEKIYGLLLHAGSDFLLEGGRALEEYLFQLKQQGVVAKIGISVYSPAELEQILETVEIGIDLVQLPLNVFDQRFLQSGWLQKLKMRGVEVHTRSLFLQGLLLMPIEKSTQQFPAFLSLLQHYKHFLHQHQLNALECNLGFIKQIEAVNKVVIGVTSVQELDEILMVCQAESAKLDYKELACTDLALIDPRMWK